MATPPLFLLPPHSTETFLALGRFQETTLSLQQHGLVLAGMSCGRGALTAHICRRSGPTPLLSYFKMSKMEWLEIVGLFSSLGYHAGWC